ncbi:MAG: hypothetical protein ACYCQJ_15005 [Nitrososphaerales archaeon]
MANAGFGTDPDGSIYWNPTTTERVNVVYNFSFAFSDISSSAAVSSFGIGMGGIDAIYSGNAITNNQYIDTAVFNGVEPGKKYLGVMGQATSHSSFKLQLTNFNIGFSLAGPEKQIYVNFNSIDYTWSGTIGTIIHPTIGGIQLLDPPAPGNDYDSKLYKLINAGFTVPVRSNGTYSGAWYWVADRSGTVTVNLSGRLVTIKPGSGSPYYSVGFSQKRIAVYPDNPNFELNWNFGVRGNDKFEFEFSLINGSTPYAPVVRLENVKIKFSPHYY